MKIGPDTYYFVGSININCRARQIQFFLGLLDNHIEDLFGEIKPILEKMDIHTSVRSKTIEFLYQKRRSSYDKLVDKGIVCDQKSQGWFVKNGKAVSRKQNSILKSQSAQESQKFALNFLQEWNDKNEKKIEELKKTGKWADWSDESFKKINSAANSKWPMKMQQIK